MEVDGLHSDFTCARWRDEWDRSRVAAVLVSPAFIERMNLTTIAAVIGESVERTTAAVDSLVTIGAVEKHDDYSRLTGIEGYNAAPWLSMMGDLLGEFADAESERAA